MLTINNEADFEPLLKRLSTWRTLFAHEAGFLDAQDAAAKFDMDLNTFRWLRSVAIDHAKRSPGKAA